MAEPQKMVHLTPVQKCRRKFGHPLTDNAPRPLTDEELKEALTVYFSYAEDSAEYREARDRIILSCLRLLRSTVARYLAHWTVCRRFTSEMVSAGSEAIVKAVDNKLTPERFEDGDRRRVLGGIAESAIRHSIETIINNLRGVMPASERTNRTMEMKKLPPIYGNTETDLQATSVRELSQSQDEDIVAFEVMDAIRTLADTNLETKILRRSNWGLTNTQVGHKVGASPQHVGRVRSYLRKRYMELGDKQ